MLNQLQSAHILIPELSFKKEGLKDPLSVSCPLFSGEALIPMRLSVKIEKRNSDLYEITSPLTQVDMSSPLKNVVSNSFINDVRHGDRRGT